MKKGNKKIWIIVAIILLIGVGVTLFFTLKDQNNSAFTFDEQKWIDDNKNGTIDLSVLNDVAILSSKGQGIFFDFLGSLQGETGLEFNKLSYKSGDEIKSSYAFYRNGEASDKDIVIYVDNYAIITNKQVRYDNLSDIKNIEIGVLKSQEDEIKKYLANVNVKYYTYNTVNDLLYALKENDAIVISKLDYLSNYNADSKTYIAYNITEMTDTYYLRLGNINELNSVLTKYYKQWYKDNYESSYNKQLTNSFLEAFDVEDVRKVKLRSKRYTYGYINDYPFDAYINGVECGINKQFVNSFMEVADVEIVYQQYSNYTELIKAFNQGNIDFMFGMYDIGGLEADHKETVSPYHEQIVVASPYGQNITINSIQSLTNMDISAVSDTKLNTYLVNNGITAKGYQSIKSLINDIEDDSVVILDLYTYNYYANKDLKNYKIDYQFYLDQDYNFVVRDPENNELFIEYLNFYLGFVNSKSYINEGYNEMLEASNDNSYLIKYALIGLLAVAFIIIVSYLVSKVINGHKKGSLTKEDKIKYTDLLTSLKNRNYLNDNMETWDASEVYPQGIVIVDLNNVAYINDNYGHAEGDNVIKEAANILVTNQVPNTEIIRTNGNEFLIYMIGYDEKQVVSYSHKITKALKELSHGFGGASGYSIITDGIKTIDDAINEATIDMRRNKEEIIG